MPNEKENTVEKTEKGKQPDPRPAAPEEELSELDVEKVAGARGWTRQP